MADYKLVGITDQSLFPPRVETRLVTERFSDHPLFRVWNGGWPARWDGVGVEPVVVIWFGPVSPGLLAKPGDYWASSDATTLASVVAAALDPASALYAAIAAAALTRVKVELFPTGASSLLRQSYGTAPDRMFGWELPAGATSLLAASVPVPVGWTTARLRIRWTRSTAGTGNARLFGQIAPHNELGVSGGAGNETSSSVPEVLALKSNTWQNPTPLVQGQGVSVAFGRMSSGADTFAGAIGIIDSWLERLS